MWATADQTRAELLDLYRAVWTHADRAIAELPLDTPALVEWWAPERRNTTFGHLLCRVVAETAQHAGHAEILREGLDGRAGRDHDAQGDAEWWTAYVGEDPGRRGPLPVGLPSGPEPVAPAGRDELRQLVGLHPRVQQAERDPAAGGARAGPVGAQPDGRRGAGPSATGLPGHREQGQDGRVADRLLLVEDDPRIRGALVLGLTDQGYEVVEAGRASPR